MRIPLLSILVLAVCSGAFGQAVNSIDFAYLYNPEQEVQVSLNPVKQRDSIVVFLRISSILSGPTAYGLKWEKRESFAQKSGVAVRDDSVSLNNGWLEKRMAFPVPEKPWLLTVRVTNKSSAKNWIFFKQIETHYPVNGYLEKGKEKQWVPYHSASDQFIVQGSGSGKPVHFSYYEERFPSPSPPFIEKELKMDPFIFPDSTFLIMPGNSVGPFTREGLYLAQEDTLSSEGFSFLIKKGPYPRYNTLHELKGPLLFVTTREENDAIGMAGENKVKFDSVILAITKDKERARKFMRNYFRRIEAANYFFTSFKEGWKTDRGMVYVVFGPPDDVRINGQQEMWEYRDPHLEFYFTRAGSVYHPDHYVLSRSKDYTEVWYSTIDLWRKSRY